MRKKGLAVCGALIVILGTIWWFLPRPMVGEDYEIQVVRNGETLEDVTDRVDLEVLEEVMQGQTRGQLRKQFAPHQLTENTVEIIGMDGEDHWIILLSENACVVYTSAEKGGWPIQSSDELWAEVLALMPK